MTRIWHLADGTGTTVAGPFLTLGEAVATLETMGYPSDDYAIVHQNLTDDEAARLITRHHQQAWGH